MVEGEGLAAMAAEAQRIVARYDLLSQLAELRASRGPAYADRGGALAGDHPGLGLASVAGIITHVGRNVHSWAGADRAGHQPLAQRDRRTPWRCPGDDPQRAFRPAPGALHGDRLLPGAQPRIRAHYDRLISRPERPLSKMTALGACMNKLLLYAFAVMKHQEAFQSEHRWRSAA